MRKSSAPPAPRFTFRDPSLGPSQQARRKGQSFGQHARKGKGSSREFPPGREVGPDDFPPEGQNETVKIEEPEENAEPDVSENEEISQQNAPLGSIRERDWAEWYSRCPGWSEL